jgi:hypothetical protein
VHVCYGNRYARPLWEGHYDFLFPAILDADVDQLVLEFARKGYDDLDLFRRYPSPFSLGLGVIDVKSREVEAPEITYPGRLRVPSCARSLPVPPWCAKKCSAPRPSYSARSLYQRRILTSVCKPNLRAEDVLLYCRDESATHT